MNVQYDFKKIQYFTSSLVIFLAILFLCAPINSLRADSITEPQTTLHKTITPISGQKTSMSCHWISHLNWERRPSQNPWM